MHLVLIETSGNQRYIFATNKLRENVGASELTYQVGTKIILESIGRKYDYKNDKGGSELRKLLLNETPIENITDENAVEIIVATSGKSILLAKNKEKAKEIVCEITERVLREMPGLTVHGAIVEVGKDAQTEQEKLKDIHNAIGNVHRELETIRHQMPTNEQRFLRLPFVAPCATSGLPAQNMGKEGGDKILLSELSVKKRNAYETSQRRLQGVVDWYREEEAINTDIRLIRGVDELENRFKDLNWLAIIHADGNGLGQIFLNFNEYAGYDENDNWSGRLYLNEYRKFSIALDICTIKAAGFALMNLQKSCEKDNTQISSIEVPVVPIVLGGDDLTFLCNGQYAIKFTHDFLTEFEAEAQKYHALVEDIIPRIVKKAFNMNYLGICAGIAIIKPHYPFHQAYELAEQLLKSAKKVKTEILQSDGRQLPSSALDFHILYDSTHSDLDEIHEKLSVDRKNTRLFAKPYVITDETKLSSATCKTWFEKRKFSELEKRIYAMSRKDDDNKNLLPSSKMHEIRESLFRGKDTAKTEVGLIKNRLTSDEAKNAFAELLINNSIFFNESGKDYTHFLDAIEAIEFWKG